MKRILFVDDEPDVLSGLQSMLHPMHNIWEMVFVTSGDQALAELEKTEFDVLVTDMRMPGMGGVTLIKRVHRQHPRLIRLVLSGYPQDEATLQTLGVSYQFLSKPCEAAALKEVVERACGLQDLLDSETLRQAVNKLGSLPSVPGVYRALLEELRDPQSNSQRLADVIKQDMAMCAKILQLVNSSFFGLPRKIASVHTAISYLGTNTLKNLVLTTELFQQFHGKENQSGFSIEVLQKHVVLTAQIAMNLCSNKRQSDNAFTAAILHDVGKLVLLTRMPDVFTEVGRMMIDEKTSMHDAEFDLLGVTHADLGAYLLGTWGLPYPIVEAVAHHHRPELIPPGTLDIGTVIYAANILAHEVSGETKHLTKNGPQAQMDDLELLGVVEEFPRWRQKAVELTSAGQA